MNKFAIASLVIAAAACGGDDAAKGTVNTASAKTSVDQLGKINSSMSTGNGANAAAALQSMTSAGQSIVTPSGGQAGREIGLLPEKFPRPDLSQAVTGTAECSATTCTFTNYGDDGASGYLINGTITKSGDNTTFNITYAVNSSGTKINWKIDGSLTLNATTIDGNVHSHGVTDVSGGSGQQAVNVTWDTQVDYNAITLDAQGCATGGDIHATVSYDVKASGQSGGSFAVQGGAKFGPACGTVTAN